MCDAFKQFFCPPSVLARRNDPGLVFSITRNGPVDFGSSFLDASVRGLRSNTKSLASIYFCLTFLSLHALVSFW
jgi:hypothetical protein